jgi:hypothetical protein
MNVPAVGFAIVLLMLVPIDRASAQGLLGGAIADFGKMIGSNEIKEAGEKLDGLHKQLKDSTPIYKQIEEGVVNSARLPFVQACIAPFQGITNWTMARCGATYEGHRQPLDAAVQLLINQQIVPASEFSGVSIRWCSLSGAHGMAPDRGVILIDMVYRNESIVNLAILIAHEMTHIMQYRRMGTDSFKCEYSRRYVDCQGCQDRRHPLEREAYEFEDRTQNILISRVPGSSSLLSKSGPPVSSDVYACTVKGTQLRIDNFGTVKPYGRVETPPLAPMCAFDLLGQNDRYCVNRADGAVLELNQFGQFVQVGACRSIN